MRSTTWPRRAVSVMARREGEAMSKRECCRWGMPFIGGAYSLTHVSGRDGDRRFECYGDGGRPLQIVAASPGWVIAYAGDNGPEIYPVPLFALVRGCDGTHEV